MLARSFSVGEYFFPTVEKDFSVIYLFFGNFPHSVFCNADTTSGGLTDRPSYATSTTLLFENTGGESCRRESPVGRC